MMINNRLREIEKKKRNKYMQRSMGIYITKSIFETKQWIEVTERNNEKKNNRKNRLDIQFLMIDI